MGAITGFAVQRRSASGWITIGFAGTGPSSGNYAFTGSFADTGLKANHRYTYRVFAFFSDNTVTGNSAKFAFKTPKAPKIHKPRAPKPSKRSIAETVALPQLV